MKKESIQAFLFVAGYGLAFYILQVLLHQRDMVAAMPGSDNLVRLDAGWYKFIADKGYIYKGHWGNVGFYPLFPLLWKLSHLGPLGISFVNIVLLAAGFALLARIYKPSAADLFIWVSTPSLFYTFVPYSEALSFLLGAMLLHGIWRQKRGQVWITLLLLALVRPVALVLLPALVLTELLAGEPKNWLRALRYSLFNYILPLVISTAAFVLYQYYSTGVWFAYFKHQADNWGRKLSIPQLPFNSVLGPKFLWLNAVALFVGFISLMVVIRMAIAWLRKKQSGLDKVLLLSLLFLAGISLLNILTYDTTGLGYTDIIGNHRYILASPYFLVFLYHFTKTMSYKPVHYLCMFLLSNLFWLLFASYLHIMFLVYFNFVTVIILMYMLYADKKLSWPALIIAAINVFVQVQAFQIFITGIYTD